MTAYIGLLNFRKHTNRSGIQELAAGRSARSIADLESSWARFLSILWATGGEYDMVPVLEAADESVAHRVFRNLEAHEHADIVVYQALVRWEQELLSQGVTLARSYSRKELLSQGRTPSA